jgi:hypothetical protein
MQGVGPQHGPCGLGWGVGYKQGQHAAEENNTMQESKGVQPEGALGLSQGPAALGP